MKVTFQIENGYPVTVDCGPGENLLEVARRAGVAIDAPCSGNGSCGKCRVRLLSGALEATPSRHLSQQEYAEGWRLSCGSRVLSDCTVLVPDIASAYRSRMKTADLSNPREIAAFEEAREALLRSGADFSNDYQALVLEMAEPSLEDTLPDNERLTRAIRAATGAETVTIPHSVMVKLAPFLRQHAFRVCAKGLLKDNTFRLLALCEAGDTVLAGCAVDIGTTTVTMVLTDLKTGALLAKGSGGNGQIRYGADVINRIIQQSRPGGVEKLKKAIVGETLNPLLQTLCGEAGLGPESVLRLAVAANTTMNHLLVGADASSIRMEPYIPSFFHWEDLLAGDLGLWANPSAPVVLSPNIGSYVGGDITAGTLAAGIWNREEMSLFIDLGTNGEIVFGNRDFLMSCACSAGPAFEGGDISCGMRATDGAVESVEIDSQTLDPIARVIGGGKPVGICGSGIIDLVAELFRTGIIDLRGKFLREAPRVKRNAHGEGRYVLAFPEESASGWEVALTEVDIDNFIRAKGAIYSAIDTLLQSVGMEEGCIDAVLVAGGIGSGIHMKNAVRIGMLPNLPERVFRYAGNTALIGAYALAMSDSAAELCRRVAANMTYVELSTCPGYMDAFVAACFLPHTDRSRFTENQEV